MDIEQFKEDLKNKAIDPINSTLMTNLSIDGAIQTLIDLTIWQQRQGMTPEQVEAHRAFVKERSKINADNALLNLMELKKTR
jgi:hypothetical protein